MKNFLILLAILSTLASNAQILVKAEVIGYGGTEIHACESARVEAIKKLKIKCDEYQLGEVTYGECKYVTEGEYYLVYKITAMANCF